jgi:RimJ/RimL family protein N-acetyltransferase
MKINTFRYFYPDNLETERLRTSFLTFKDIPNWATFFQDKEATELFPDFGTTDELKISEQWIQRQLNRYQNNQFGLQALFRKETDEFIGLCGLVSQIVDEIEEIEVGYHILKKFWGNGFAPETAKCFINYAFENQLTQSVISIIDIRNVKSQRVAEKNNLFIDKQTKWNNLDVYIYRINHENWLKNIYK